MRAKFINEIVRKSSGIESLGIGNEYMKINGWRMFLAYYIDTYKTIFSRFRSSKVNTDISGMPLYEKAMQMICDKLNCSIDDLMEIDKMRVERADWPEVIDNLNPWLNSIKFDELLIEKKEKPKEEVFAYISTKWNIGEIAYSKDNNDETIWFNYYYARYK